MTTPSNAHHFYATGDPVPQVVIVSGDMAWLPEGKFVPVATLQGKLVKLVELKEEAKEVEG